MKSLERIRALAYEGRFIEALGLVSDALSLSYVMAHDDGTWSSGGRGRGYGLLHGKGRGGGAGVRNGGYGNGDHSIRELSGLGCGSGSAKGKGRLSDKRMSWWET